MKAIFRLPTSMPVGWPSLHRNPRQIRIYAADVSGLCKTPNTGNWPAGQRHGDPSSPMDATSLQRALVWCVIHTFNYFRVFRRHAALLVVAIALL